MSKNFTTTKQDLTWAFFLANTADISFYLLQAMNLQFYSKRFSFFTLIPFSANNLDMSFMPTSKTCTLVRGFIIIIIKSFIRHDHL